MAALYGQWTQWIGNSGSQFQMFAIDNPKIKPLKWQLELAC